MFPYKCPPSSCRSEWNREKVKILKNNEVNQVSYGLHNFIVQYTYMKSSFYAIDPAVCLLIDK